MSLKRPSNAAPTGMAPSRKQKRSSTQPHNPDESDFPQLHRRTSSSPGLTQLAPSSYMFDDLDLAWTHGVDHGQTDPLFDHLDAVLGDNKDDQSDSPELHQRTSELIASDVVLGDNEFVLDCSNNLAELKAIFQMVSWFGIVDCKITPEGIIITSKQPGDVCIVSAFCKCNIVMLPGTQTLRFDASFFCTCMSSINHSQGESNITIFQPKGAQSITIKSIHEAKDRQLQFEMDTLAEDDTAQMPELHDLDWAVVIAMSKQTLNGVSTRLDKLKIEELELSLHYLDIDSSHRAHLFSMAGDGKVKWSQEFITINGPMDTPIVISSESRAEDIITPLTINGAHIKSNGVQVFKDNYQVSFITRIVKVLPVGEVQLRFAPATAMQIKCNIGGADHSHVSFVLCSQVDLD